MQTIKFRAWDNVAFQMYHPGEEDNIVFALEDNGIVATDITQEEEEFQTLHHLEYMQFTGLHDRNGKEIYEHDFIELHQFLFDGEEFENELIGEVIYNPGACAFSLTNIKHEGVKSYMGYREDEDCGSVPMFDFYGLHEESFTVLGNRFENPELLKEETK